MQMDYHANDTYCTFILFCQFNVRNMQPQWGSLLSALRARKHFVNLLELSKLVKLRFFVQWDQNKKKKPLSGTS